ncbi:ATP-binding protein [Candidatus Dojkabacteria bacterium]|jgi:adenylate kinase family enzyme|nr:ATP-binding protein [Candidatus Dojkabacteria bacterium]
MRILIIGAQGTGKTTLANDIVSANPELKLLPEVARMALAAGFKLDKSADFETELWIALTQIGMEDKAGDNWVADRGLVDLLAYVINLFPEDEHLMNIIQRMLEKRLKTYDLVIYLPTGEFPLVEDGVRLIDYDFQESIDLAIRQIIDRYGISVVKITGKPKERLSLAIFAIKTINKE